MKYLLSFFAILLAVSCTFDTPSPTDEIQNTEDLDATTSLNSNDAAINGGNVCSPPIHLTIDGVEYNEPILCPYPAPIVMEPPELNKSDIGIKELTK